MTRSDIAERVLDVTGETGLSMNYAMEDGPVVFGATGNFLGVFGDIMGWGCVGLVALAFGYVVLLGVADMFKLGPYSPAGIAKAKARRLENKVEAKRRFAMASAEARRHDADVELLRRAMDRIERDV